MKSIQSLGNFLASYPVGIAGGAFCAFFILSFGALIGRSGTTGCEYIGYWEPAYIILSVIYGGLFGLLGYPISFILFFRKLEVFTLLRISLRIGGWTILSGCIGATASPPLAVLTAFTGFFIASARAAQDATHKAEQDAAANP